jgi:hypothetical protein
MTELHEKLGELNAKTKAAHARLDRLETDLRNDLKEILKEIKELNAHVNKSRGWAGAALLISGLLGAGIVKLLGLIFKT